MEWTKSISIEVGSSLLRWEMILHTSHLCNWNNIRQESQSRDNSAQNTWPRQEQSEISQWHPIAPIIPLVAMLSRQSLSLGLLSGTSKGGHCHPSISTWLQDQPKQKKKGLRQESRTPLHWRGSVSRVTPFLATTQHSPCNFLASVAWLLWEGQPHEDVPSARPFNNPSRSCLLASDERTIAELHRQKPMSDYVTACRVRQIVAYVFKRIVVVTSPDV